MNKHIKVLIFDLDGTLAPFNHSATAGVCRRLKELEDRGLCICICSGKPLAYLCGFARQLGLKEPVLLGENGADIQRGIVFPPEEYLRLSCPPQCMQKLDSIRRSIQNQFPSVWFQPNSIVLTPFFKDESERLALRSLIARMITDSDEIEIYEHCDCFDLVPAGVNKREGLLALSRMLNIPAEHFAAIGDGVNDYPMFDTAGLSVGIALPDSAAVDYNAGSIDAALDYLISI